MRLAQPMAASRSRAQVVSVRCQFDVRPYTLRKGDTITSIADKRGLTVKDVLSINHDIKPDTLREGQTILLPANKLSKRDAEILAGIGPRSYRLYPVRKGETLEAILTARKISQEEFRALNPSAGDSVKENQLLKLPAHKFTVREREMLIGAGILPREFFSGVVNSPFALGGAVILAVCAAVLVWQRFYDEDAH